MVLMASKDDISVIILVIQSIFSLLEPLTLANVAIHS